SRCRAIALSFAASLDTASRISVRSPVSHTRISGSGPVEVVGADVEARGLRDALDSVENDDLVQMNGGEKETPSRSRRRKDRGAMGSSWAFCPFTACTCRRGR